MHVTSGRFETAHAAKYIQQLCKHFGHKVAVEYTADEGRAELPIGPAIMRAREDALLIEIHLTDPDMIEQAHHIIDSHLVTFAFREKFAEMDWDSPTG